MQWYITGFSVESFQGASQRARLIGVGLGLGWSWVGVGVLQLSVIAARNRKIGVANDETTAFRQSVNNNRNYFYVP
jgi:hypothetical protein